MFTREQTAQIYERAGFSHEHSGQLASIASVLFRINDRLIGEGQPGLVEQHRQRKALLLTSSEQVTTTNSSRQVKNF